MNFLLWAVGTAVSIDLLLTHLLRAIPADKLDIYVYDTYGQALCQYTDCAADRYFSGR